MTNKPPPYDHVGQMQKIRLIKDTVKADAVDNWRRVPGDENPYAKFWFYLTIFDGKVHDSPDAKEVLQFHLTTYRGLQNAFQFWHTLIDAVVSQCVIGDGELAIVGHCMMGDDPIEGVRVAWVDQREDSNGNRIYRLDWNSFPEWVTTEAGEKHRARKTA